MTSPRTRIGVDEYRALNPETKNIEERFAEPIAGGPHRQAGDTLQRASAMRAGDDPH